MSPSYEVLVACYVHPSAHPKGQRLYGWFAQFLGFSAQPPFARAVDSLACDQLCFGAISARVRWCGCGRGVWSVVVAGLCVAYTLCDFEIIREPRVNDTEELSPNGRYHGPWGSVPGHKMAGILSHGHTIDITTAGPSRSLSTDPFGPGPGIFSCCRCTGESGGCSFAPPALISVLPIYDTPPFPPTGVLLGSEGRYHKARYILLRRRGSVCALQPRRTVPRARPEVFLFPKILDSQRSLPFYASSGPSGRAMQPRGKQRSAGRNHSAGAGAGAPFPPGPPGSRFPRPKTKRPKGRRAIRRSPIQTKTKTPLSGFAVQIFRYHVGGESCSGFWLKPEWEGKVPLVEPRSASPRPRRPRAPPGLRLASLAAARPSPPP